MYGISSTLASQTINKATVWNCLVILGLVSGDLDKFTADRMTVEGWAVGVRVVIKRAYKGIQVFKGLSTIISPLKIAMHIFEREELKSRGLSVIRKNKNLFLVDSCKDPKQKHAVRAYSYGLECSCMKFKCMRNRIEKEAPQLLKALGKVSLLDGSQIAYTEQYDTSTHTLEGKVHLQCHHIRAVMRKAFNAFTSLEYLMNWKQVINSYVPNQDSWMDADQWREELFPPSMWGEFKRKSG